MRYSSGLTPTEHSGARSAQPRTGLVLDTISVEQAQADVGRLLTSHRLRLLGSTRQFRARLWAEPSDAVWFGRFNYGADVEITAHELGRYFVIVEPLAGAATVTHAGQQALSRLGTAAVVSPEKYVSMRWSRDLDLLCVRIDRAALERRLGELLGYEPAKALRFDLAFDTVRCGKACWGMVYLLRQYIEKTPGAACAPLIRADIEHGIMTSLLLSQQHTYTEALQKPVLRPSSRAVRAAVELMREDPDQLLTGPGIAAAVGVSERTLQLGFRREFGCSPTAFRRQVRLDRMREDLLWHRGAESATVREIALRWGFSNQGRAAAAYRQRFGETPAETLRGRASENGHADSDSE
jgi:AraC-like DNA-binding protein